MKSASLLALLLCALCACKSETPADEIVVVVDSDMRIGMDLASLEVRIDDRALDAGTGDLVLNTFTLAVPPSDGASLPKGVYPLPLSFVVAPLAQNSTRDFRLIVTGHDANNTVVVEQQIISSFRPKYSGRLDVFLAQRCVQQLCYDQSGQRTAQTCNVATGKCDAIPTVVAQKIEDGDSLAGYARDAGRDAGMDASTSGGDGGGPASDGGVAPNDGGSVPDGAPSNSIAPPTDANDHLIASAGSGAIAAASRSGRGAVVYQQVDPTSPDPTNPNYRSFVVLYEPDTGWGVPFSLTTNPPSEYGDSVPNAIFDDVGNMTVVWLRGFDMLARRNTAADKAWSGEVKLHINNCGGAPNLTVDPAGNVMAVYIVDDYDYNTARFEVQTGVWNTLLGNINATKGNDETPTMASDANGNVFAIWAANNEVFANRFDAVLKGWGGSVTIRSSTANKFRTGASHVAVNDAGAALAVWMETNTGVNYEVGANAWDPSARAWRSTALDDATLRVGEGQVAGLAADPSGGFIAFWDNQIRWFDASTFTVGGPIPIGRQGSLNLVDPFEGQLGADGNGTHVAAWAQSTPNGIDVAWSAAPHPASGAEVWSDVVLAGGALPPGDAMAVLGYPTMSVGPAGRALIAWSQALTSDATPPTAVYARWIAF